jgi:RNA polymerase sigma-70 factor (ECF subfamily)
MAKHRILNILKQSYNQNLASRKLSMVTSNADNVTEKAVDYSLLARKVGVIVDKLPPRQKNVYLLSRYQGLKQEEIASRMGITVTTVKKHLTLALNFIRKNIDLSLLIGIFIKHLDQ